MYKNVQFTNIKISLSCLIENTDKHKIGFFIDNECSILYTLPNMKKPCSE